MPPLAKINVRHIVQRLNKHKEGHNRRCAQRVTANGKMTYNASNARISAPEAGLKNGIAAILGLAF